jgi:hypothetical protein
VTVPAFFATTTLRTLAAESGEGQDEIRACAKAAHIRLRVGNGPDADLAGRIFVELTARTFGSLELVGVSRPIDQELAELARSINPRVSLAPRERGISVSVCAPDRADIAYSGHGWWVGPGAPSVMPSGNPLGPLAAGVLAFNDVFRLAFADVFPELPARPEVSGWSLRDWGEQPLDEEDLEPLPTLSLSPTALVGCGAIGQAFAYSLGHLRPAGGPLDLIDPQALSHSNLQRYLGTTEADASSARHKAVLAARHFASSGVAIRQWAGRSWAAYRKESAEPPHVAITALDTARDRALVQASMPRWTLNGWTRMSECGVALHDFVGADQCVVCTYLPRTPGEAGSDFEQLKSELGLEPMRLIHLMAGASLQRQDLARIAQHRGIAPEALERWRGESLRSLFGHLCGVAEIRSDLRDQYAVPLPQASALAGILLAAQYLKVAAGMPFSTRPIEVSLLRGPGRIWEQPPARKDQHPAPCICKDERYLRTFREMWGVPPNVNSQAESRID